VPAMHTPKDLPAWSREDLLAWVAALQRQIAELTAHNDALRAELDQLTRSGKRQATPFSQGTRVPAPQAPGRKPRSGSCRSREAPPPEAITEPPVDVTVTRAAYPVFGGLLTAERVDVVSRTELPEHPRPTATPYRVWVCRCMVCGTQVRGQPPDVALDHAGATARRVGARVRAAAHAVHDGIGIPVRQVPWVLSALTGVRLTQGAITRDALPRAGGVVGTASKQLRAVVPEMPVVHPDDTGWRVGGEPAHLLAFETDAATVSQMRRRHRHNEVQAVIPADDAGVLVTDRGRS
jgi:transposase